METHKLLNGIGFVFLATLIWFGQVPQFLNAIFMKVLLHWALNLSVLALTVEDVSECDHGAAHFIEDVSATESVQSLCTMSDHRLLLACVNQATPCKSPTKQTPSIEHSQDSKRRTATYGQGTGTVWTRRISYSALCYKKNHLRRMTMLS